MIFSGNWDKAIKEDGLIAGRVEELMHLSRKLLLWIKAVL